MTLHRTDSSRQEIPIHTPDHVLLAAQQGRALAEQEGFRLSEQAAIVTAITEVARNMLLYARQGRVSLRCQRRGKDDRIAIVIVAQDEGPGIADVEQAMRDGYSTGGGLGLGLPGARRLMDEFEIRSEVGTGTVVRMSKWKR